MTGEISIRKGLFLCLSSCCMPWSPSIDQCWLDEPLTWLNIITQATHYRPDLFDKCSEHATESYLLNFHLFTE